LLLKWGPLFVVTPAAKRGILLSCLHPRANNLPGKSKYTCGRGMWLKGKLLCLRQSESTHWAQSGGNYSQLP
jgi:hypothetical protein